MAYKLPITNNSIPACLVYNPSSITNVTGDGTVYTINFNTEIYDKTSNFNTGTATFTAPVTGKYWVNLGVLFNDLTASHTSSNIIIVSSNRSFTENLAAGTCRNSANQFQQSMSTDVDMDASDTITFTTTVSGGTKVVDVQQGGATDLRSYATVRLTTGG